MGYRTGDDYCICWVTVKQSGGVYLLALTLASSEPWHCAAPPPEAFAAAAASFLAAASSSFLYSSSLK